MTNLLAALRLADSFFPSGMFTQSHGLESFVAAGAHGETQIEPLLHSYLRHVAAPGDALAARWVARLSAQDALLASRIPHPASQHINALDEIAAIDQRLEATKLAPEGRIASRRCGGRVLLLGVDVYGGEMLHEYARRVRAGDAPGHQSVALALVAAAAGLDEELAVLVELHAFASSIVSAALRLGALDHIAAQRLLHRAAPVIAEAAETGKALHWRDIGGYAPQIEHMQMQHRYAETHMFVS